MKTPNALIVDLAIS